jgi:hypothetical protein
MLLNSEKPFEKRNGYNCKKRNVEKDILNLPWSLVSPSKQVS